MHNGLFKIEVGCDGGIRSLETTGDGNALNWVEGRRTYGTPYGEYALLELDTERENETVAVYEYKGLRLEATRKLGESALAERYVFENVADEDRTFRLGDLGIVACFNDNYDIARIALDKRCHMHIWTGENSAYIRCARMNGVEKDNVALLVTKGAIAKYAIDREWNSNDRGDVSLLLPPITIKAGEKYELEFHIFKYDTLEDFTERALSFDSFTDIKCDKYTARLDESVRIVLRGKSRPTLVCEGKEIATRTIDESTYSASCSFDSSGEKRIDVFYGEGYRTFVELNVISSIEHLIDSRIQFIADRQQCVKKGKLYGAIMLYDNDTDKPFAENKPLNDRNLSRERVGMLCAMQQRYLLGNMCEEFETKLRKSIEIGMDFVDKNIVNRKGDVFEVPRYRKKPFIDRLYNYSMYMTAYALTYRITGNKYYLDKAFSIAKRYYKKGGIKFYAINIPMNEIYIAAKENGYSAMAEELKSMFLAHGERIMSIGADYPAHEVKYEQSIVAPSVETLLECYMLSEDKRFLDEAERQLRLLEAFNGNQPSFHLNEIAIRHWDGFWFGKNKMYGDTFPHYWSCITAAAFAKYAKITGNEEYARRAENCLVNNLCLFTEEGKGSCAYVYPYSINGISGEFYDPWANDQDWAIYYNLKYGKTYSQR